MILIKIIDVQIKSTKDSWLKNLSLRFFIATKHLNNLQDNNQYQIKRGLKKIIQNHLWGKEFVVGMIAILTITVFIPSVLSTSVITNAKNITITIQTNGEATDIQYHLCRFTKVPVTINQVTYDRILLEDESNILLNGAPDVPHICRSIVIPDFAKMEIKVVSAVFEEYTSILIAPSKGNLPRMIQPDSVPYEFSDIYRTDGWYPSQVAELGEPYVMRDFRGQVITINPIQYNPSTKTMRFYTDITVEIFPGGTDERNIIQRETLPSKITTDFTPIYQRHFMNFNTFSRYKPVEEQGSMLVITYDGFWDAMLPFVQWKNMKGVPTKMVKVSTIGDANAIKAYIAEQYNTTGIAFVLLVGDAAQVPTYYDGGGASDPSYSYIIGDDHYPDLFIGRFSAETIEQVSTQVQRSVEYERDPQSNASWYTQGIGIASDQGPGDDGEIDYQHLRNIRSLLLNFTYAHVDELYDGSQGGQDAAGNPTPTMVATSINNGSSIINYCGHGTQTSWGTSGFSNNDVNALTNDNMLPFIVSAGCNNGEFDFHTCFAEAWLRASHNGEPTGAIGAYMSTISQSWEPPMEAQDEINNILVGMYPENRRTTFGALCFEGAMAMNDDYGSQGYIECDAWTVFGDPSLQVRTNVPSAMNVTHPSDIEAGVTTFNVTVANVSGALCAISRNFVLLGSAYTNETGHATITFSQPMTGGVPVDLIVTAFNKIPYMSKVTVLYTNQPPNPPTITGPHYGKTNTTYTFSLGAITDPEQDQLFCLFDWGDGDTSGWLGPYDSGVTVNASYAWREPGNYTVRVKLKDSYGAESDWSAPFFITIVQLKTAFFLGTFKPLNQTEDLIVIESRFFIVFPSHLILHRGEIIVLSKEYFGYHGKMFTIGMGGIAIL
jgi:hypothetical protein